MAHTVVRPYQPGDEEGFASVRSLTYNDGLPIPPERAESRFSDRFVATIDNEVAGIFSVLPMTASRGDALLKSGGVASVAVSPERRRSGIGQAMMDWLPGHLKSTGVHLASLYAYRETFYAKSGYAVVGKRVVVRVPVHRLPKVESDLQVRRLTPADWHLIHPCHAAFAHARSGVHVRNELMWERILNENKPLTIYASGDPVEGYVAVSHSTSFWTEQFLSEVVWSTPRGYQACLETIRQLGINKGTMAWFEPSDSPYCAFYVDQGVQFGIERPVMFRVCDVPGALRLLKPAGSGEFTIKVLDAQVPSNEGPWLVKFSPGEVQVTPSPSADITLDIRPFTQAFMGEPSLTELIRHGAVTSDNPEALAAAQQLLPALPVYCSDFF